MTRFLAAALLIASAAPGVAATTWDANSDFHLGAAPAGNPWSYGAGEGGASFTAHDQTGSYYAFACNFGGGNYSKVCDYAGTNGAADSDSSGIYSDPDALLLHPGQFGGEGAVVRFTATTAGSYSLQSSFETLDYGAVDGVNALVLHNGFSLYSGYLGGSVASASGPGGAISFSSALLTLGVGDTIDFVVDKNGSYNSDTTGLKAQVTLIAAAPVPEPGEWAMMAGGLGIVGGAAKRRRHKIQGE